jgi:UDP-glucose 4-epimerase
MKILVTGGSGFIGQHIAEMFASEEHEAIVIDKRKNTWPFLYNNILLVEEDIRNYDQIKNYFEDVDYIFHEAALVSVPESMKKPNLTIDNNINGTVNILKAAVEKNVKKVIFASSCAIYGMNDKIPLNENEKAYPLSPYAISKLSAEYFLKMYNEEFGIKTTSLRYFNVYGPRQDYSSQYSAVISIFVNNALQDKDLIVYGDGSQTRDFVYIDDVVKANKMVMNQGDGEIFNVGFGEKASISELAKEIIELTNSDSKIIYKQARYGEVKHSLADITKISQIGFKPEINFKEGLEKLIAFFKKC